MTSILEKIRPIKKRLIAAAILGALLASLAIYVVTTIYDPFSDDVADLKLLLPDDVDVMIESRDFPTLVRELEDRSFYRELDRNPEFRRFLESPMIEETGIVTILGDALREIRSFDAKAELPFDLQVLGDLSGRQVVIGGYAPVADGDAFRFIGAIKPESAWGIVFANILTDEFLADQFVADELDGITLRHRSWGVELAFDATAEAEERTISLARIENAILFSNDSDLLAGHLKDLLLRGIPFTVHPRFDDGWAWDEGPEDSSLNLLISRRVADAQIGVTDRFLVPMWGDDIAGVFERMFPMLEEGGDDKINIDLRDEARLRWSAEFSRRLTASPFSKMSAIDRSTLNGQTSQVLGKLPYYVFGYTYLQTGPGDLLRFALSDPELIDRDKKLLWFEELADRVERFGGRQQGVEPNLTEPLAEEFDRTFAPGVGLVMFDKPRDDSVVDSSPGVAVVLKVKDDVYLDRFLVDIKNATAAADISAFEVVESGSLKTWRITNTSFLDDPINNRPGFARLGDWFIITNWFPVFTDTRRVEGGELNGFSGVPLLDYTLRQRDDEARGFLYLDAARFFDFTEVAKEGWIEERSKITDQEIFAKARELELEALRLTSLTPAQREDWTDRQFRTWKAQAQRDKNPSLIRREIDTTLGYFRNAFSFFYLSLGARDDRLRLDLRLDTREE